MQPGLANGTAAQALFAESRNDMAQADQTGPIANPIFTFERVRLGDEREIGRLLSLGLLHLLTLPQRQAAARSQVAQARVQLATQLVEHVMQLASTRAVGAQQALLHAQQVHRAAEASAELARRMQPWPPWVHGAVQAAASCCKLAR